MEVKTAITLAEQGKLKKPVTISPQEKNKHIWQGAVILCQDEQQRKGINWNEGDLIITLREFLAACRDIKAGKDIGKIICIMREFGCGMIE